MRGRMDHRRLSLTVAWDAHASKTGGSPPMSRELDFSRRARDMGHPVDEEKLLGRSVEFQSGRGVVVRVCSPVPRLGFRLVRCPTRLGFGVFLLSGGDRENSGQTAENKGEKW